MARVLAGLVVMLVASSSQAQFGGGGFGGGGQGGGVYIDPEAIIRIAEQRGKAKAVYPKLSKELAARTDLRRVSLHQLDRQLRTALEAKQSVPDDLACLAGLSKIEYVLFDKDRKEVLLAGPAEGWRIEPDGRTVGATSNRPTLRLEDLAVALRCVLNGPGQIHCSIDPQKAGLAAMRSYDYPVAKTRAEEETIRKEVVDKIGTQTVETKGVPDGSRFALAMIDADYRMKRMAMGLEKAAGVTTHLDVLVRLAEKGENNPHLARWWFTPWYEAVIGDESGSVFQFRGQGVKLLNESIMVDAQGNRRGTGREGDGDQFASSFTKRFPELENRFAAFADLHNLFDVMLVAGLIRRQGAGDWFAGSALLDEKLYSPRTATQPRFAEPAVSVLRSRRTNRIFTTVAFGGVSMRPADVLGPEVMKTDSSTQTVPTKELLAPTVKSSSTVETPSPASQVDNKATSDEWWTDLKVAAFELPRQP